MTRATRSPGFTLVEIMIVLLIVALLLTMAIPAYQKIRQSQNVAPPTPAGAPAKP